MGSAVSELSGSQGAGEPRGASWFQGLETRAGALGPGSLPAPLPSVAVKCSVCKSVSDTYDPYLDVALEIRVQTRVAFAIGQGEQRAENPKQQRPTWACYPVRSGEECLESCCLKT